LGSYVGQFVRWLGALVVASLLIPAITAQWSDRQKELELKTALISEVTESAASAVQEASNLVDVEQKAWPTIKSDPRFDKTADEWYGRYRAILKTWKVAAFSLESRLFAYFPNADIRLPRRPQLAGAFHVYNVRVQMFILLTLNLCRNERLQTRAVAQLARYLSVDFAREYKPIIDDAPPRGAPRRCWRKTRDFFTAYDALGSKLLKQRSYFADAIVHSHAAGYSVGLGALVRQVWLAFVALLAVGFIGGIAYLASSRHRREPTVTRDPNGEEA
jgi:hypothetical protein